MKSVTALLWKTFAVVLLAVLAGCRNRGPETAATAVSPTATPAGAPTREASSPLTTRDFIVIATDAPNPPFSDFDQFGNVIGFNNDLMARISAVADFDYEFVVTPHEGVLDSVAAHTDFDAVMSALILPEEPEPGIAYTDPYLEVGQVMVVLADERELLSYRELQPGMAVGVQTNSNSAETAYQMLNLNTADVFEYESVVGALQALVEEAVDAVILDSYIAEHFTQAFPEQLKIAGGTGRNAWISSRAYSIAVAADNTELLSRLNEAIAQAKEEQTIERLVVAWMIPGESIDAGESRVGTPASELIIGIMGQLTDMDPATGPSLIGWELKTNTMSGLFMVNSRNELVPVLAADFPAVSEDKLEYTFSLRRGLRFPDGSEFTAEDVKWSIGRAAGLGSFLINDFLKDSNDDTFADEDAVQVIDQYTVKFVLQAPTSYFLSLLATPPYFPISDECYAETWDFLSTCGGIGPYTIVSWSPNERMRLKANPEWPGRPAPAFENIQVRFYEDVASMRRSLEEFQSLDIAWTGLPFADYMELRERDADGDGVTDFISWEGPAVFKSYLIFEQETRPWNSKKVRQAAAYAVDREALAAVVFAGSRRPLYSPVPDNVPGFVPALPRRDLEKARALLREEGYSEDNPLAITIWYLNDGRYTPLEEAYANAIKQQLEETGIFQVTLASDSWDAYRTQIAQCNYPAYLLGWPSPGQPVNYLDMTAWTDFFVQNTDRVFCSNYESETMDQLVTAAREELDQAARLELYGQIQQLWADELPTLDLTQEPRHAISLPKVEDVRIDAMGMLHYEVLSKGGG